MLTILVIMKHSPENCVMLHESMREMYVEAFSKMPELAKKHGVKLVGGWSANSEHLMIAVWEAPTVEAYMKFANEPAMVKFIHSQDSSEMRIVQTFEEGMKVLKEAK